jgi:hypothetical protein
VVKVYVVSTAEGLLKLNSNTAGLPSVAEAGVIVGYSWSRIIIIVPVAEAFQSNAKGLRYFHQSVVGTRTVP